MDYTTIQIKPETREKLARLKSSPRETYDELVNTLVELAPYGDDEGEYSDEFRASLIRSMKDFREGRTYTMEEIKKKLGVQ